MFSQELLDRSNCPSCQQYARRLKINSERTRARAKGIPMEMCPKFSEVNLGSNYSCEVCVERMSYFRDKKRAEKFRKGKGISISRS